MRRRILAIIIIGAAGVFPFALGANAVPPANDECEGAIFVPVGGSGTADNCEAADGVDDPEPSCAFGANFGSVYFKLVPTATSARIRTDLNSVAPDSDFAVYAVNQGIPCDETQWVEVGCAEDGDFKFNGDICIEGLVPGDTYKILLVSFSQASCGEYLVDIESPCPATNGLLRSPASRAETTVSPALGPRRSTGPPPGAIMSTKFS